jgi:hypothetical protein
VLLNQAPDPDLERDQVDPETARESEVHGDHRPPADWTSTNKEPEYIPLTLDIATTTKVFDKVKSILAQVHGVMSVPLVYVIRVALIPEDKKDDPPFGEEETKYTSIDMETMARTPILSNEADFNKEFENLEAYGPFVPTYLTNTKKVWSILLACFGISSTWQHVKKFATSC